MLDFGEVGLLEGAESETVAGERSSGRGGSGERAVDERAVAGERGEVGSEGAGEAKVLDVTCWCRGTLADIELERKVSAR